jgi:hypothetical protein
MLELTLKGTASAKVHDPIALEVGLVNRTSAPATVPDIARDLELPVFLVAWGDRPPVRLRRRNALARTVGTHVYIAPVAMPRPTLAPGEALVSRIDLLTMTGALPPGDYEITATVPDAPIRPATHRLRVEPAGVGSIATFGARSALRASPRIELAWQEAVSGKLRALSFGLDRGEGQPEDASLSLDAAAIAGSIELSLSQTGFDGLPDDRWIAWMRPDGALEAAQVSTGQAEGRALSPALGLEDPRIAPSPTQDMLRASGRTVGGKLVVQRDLAARAVVHGLEAGKPVFVGVALAPSGHEVVARVPLPARAEHVRHLALEGHDLIVAALPRPGGERDFLAWKWIGQRISPIGSLGVAKRRVLDMALASEPKETIDMALIGSAILAGKAPPKPPSARTARLVALVEDEKDQGHVVFMKVRVVDDVPDAATVSRTELFEPLTEPGLWIAPRTYESLILDRARSLLQNEAGDYQRITPGDDALLAIAFLGATAPVLVRLDRSRGLRVEPVELRRR